MIYSDSENLAWWKNLSNAEQERLLNSMVDVTGSEFSNSLYDQWLDGKEFSVKQIAAVRKWA